MRNGVFANDHRKYDVRAPTVRRATDDFDGLPAAVQLKHHALVGQEPLHDQVDYLAQPFGPGLGDHGQTSGVDRS